MVINSINSIKYGDGTVGRVVALELSDFQSRVSKFNVNVAKAALPLLKWGYELWTYK